MLSQVEAHRLAAAINQLRPDWPLASLSTWIRSNLAERAYRDAAIALTWVACEPETVSPGRVLEAGPWWKATQAQAPTLAAVTHMCPTHPAEKAWNCGLCSEDSDGVNHAAGAATVREALRSAPRPPRAQEPRKPEPIRDLAVARALADKEQP